MFYLNHLVPLENTSARVWYCFRAKFSNHYPLGSIVLLVHVCLNESALVRHFPISNCESIFSRRCTKLFELYIKDFHLSWMQYERYVRLPTSDYNR